MKNILIAIFLLSSVLANAQNDKKVIVNGVDLNTQDIKFVEIVSYTVPFSQKVTVQVYYGQQIKVGDDQRIEGTDGKVIKFYGTIDALNFMYKNGWDFVNAYAVSSANQLVYHYIMKKKD